jgi:hypothetical protein
VLPTITHGLPVEVTEYIMDFSYQNKVEQRQSTETEREPGEISSDG